MRGATFMKLGRAPATTTSFIEHRSRSGSIWGLCDARADGSKESNDHLVELACTQFREHRQRQDFTGSPLRMGEVAFFVAQVSISLLQVDRNRVVDACLYSSIMQRGLENVASRVSHGINMVDMASMWHWGRRLNPGVSE